MHVAKIKCLPVLPPATQRRRLTEAEIERIITLRERGIGLTVIAEEIGCSVGAVQWQSLRLGAETPRPRPLKPVPEAVTIIHCDGHVRRYFTRAEDEIILAMTADGHTNSEIGRALSRKPHTVLCRKTVLARHAARKERA